MKNVKKALLVSGLLLAGYSHADFKNLSADEELEIAVQEMAKNESNPAFEMMLGALWAVLRWHQFCEKTEEGEEPLLYGCHQKELKDLIRYLKDNDLYDTLLDELKPCIEEDRINECVEVLLKYLPEDVKNFDEEFFQEQKKYGREARL